MVAVSGFRRLRSGSNKKVVRLEFPPPAQFLQIAVIAMQRNWVMQYSNSQPRPQRFNAPDTHWLDLQDSLNRWGGSKTWQQFQQLGQIATFDSN